MEAIKSCERGAGCVGGREGSEDCQNAGSYRFLKVDDVGSKSEVGQTIRSGIG